VHDIRLLYAIQKHLGCGHVYEENTQPMAIWRVTKLDDLVTKVLPLFEVYPQQTKRRDEFNIFRQVVLKMEKREHLASEAGNIECARLARSLRVKFHPSNQTAAGLESAIIESCVNPF
jgi:hypothetical protein